MAETEIRLEIVTPDSTVYSEIVDHVVVPTANGKIDLFQHHAPLIDRLEPSDIKVLKDGKVEYLAVGAGFVEVYAEKVSIITDQAILVDEDNNEIFLFYSESRECIRIAPQEGDFNPSGVQNDRQLPGGDIMMTSLKVPTFENYEWLKSVRWAPPKKIFRQGDVGKGVGPIPKVIANPMIVLRSGVWLLPYWREPHDAPPCSNLLLTKGNAGVLRSRDNGKTWKAYGKLDHPRTWLIENTLSERDDGSVLMLFRTKIGVLYASASYDEGITWTPPESTAIPNPDSKIVLTRLHSGALAMVLNAHGKLKGQKRHARTFLDVAVSGDGGATWRRIARLEDESQSPLVRSHYPTAIEAFREGGTRLLITYSKFYFGLGGLDQAIQEQRPMGIRLQSISLK